MFNARALLSYSRQTLLPNTILLTVTFVIGLAFCEAALRYYTSFPIHAPNGNRTFDDHLLYRMDTNLAGIDAAGFRNPESYVNDFPKIAAVGDSFTYGYNVSSEASWPRQFGGLIGERVYNFGIGGYSLLQYVELVRLAVGSGAKTIIVGLLPENDMSICEVARLTHWNEILASGGGDGDLLKNVCSLSLRDQRPTCERIDRRSEIK